MPSNQISKAEYDVLIGSKMSELVLQRQTMKDLEWVGFSKDLIYHTHFSKRSVYGYPDIHAIRRSTDRVPAWVTYRKPRQIFAELKTETGTATLEQVMWLDALADQRDNGNLEIEVYLIRPSDVEAFRLNLLHGPIIGGGLVQWPTGQEETRRKARPSRRGASGVRRRRRRV